MRKLIIQGSSRSKGDTNTIVELLRQEGVFDLIDLKGKNIGPFDYEFNNQDDDFLPLVQDIIDRYDLIVFATPVYWYSMSGILKNFFDRISDLLKVEKDTGRKLRGKKMAMLCCSHDQIPTEGFHVPFRNSAEYLGMEYLGDIHTWVEEDGRASEEIQERVRAFAQTL